MTIRTLLRYLFFFDRQAIQDIAACRKAVWLGLLFVLSAGFAREYDGEDLLAEPWHLLLPLAASLITSFLLFGFVWLIDRGWKQKDVPFNAAYRSFLGLYWMTAPLAWLYAIPVERFLSPGEAVRANLWLLAIVAAWRVALMVRVVSILFRSPVAGAMFPVLWFADSVALVILYFTPLPVFSLMGGIRLTESEQVLQSTAFLVGAVGYLSWPIWLIGTVVVAAKPLIREMPLAQPLPHSAPVSTPLRGLAMTSLAVWMFILPFVQPEQQRRRQVETLLRTGRIEQAIERMSAYERSDFPPHWEPPPRLGYGEETPELLDVMQVVISMESKPWVSQIYWGKFRDLVEAGNLLGRYWDRMHGEDLDRHLTILEHLPAHSSLLAEQRKKLTALLKEDYKLNAAQRDRLRKLLGEDGDDGLRGSRLDRDSEGMDETLENTP